MKKLRFEKTSIEGLMVIEPFCAPDERGYFSKYFEADIFKEHGIRMNVHECCESRSTAGVIRGLHFQRRHWQDKLVRCLSGELFDVAVDLRKGSPTFGKWEGFFLSPENQKLVYIPVGFAHGFLALKPNTIISYLCGDRYDPESDGGIRWNDPDLGVDWPMETVGTELIVSEKDGNLPFLREVVFN